MRRVKTLKGHAMLFIKRLRPTTSLSILIKLCSLTLLSTLLLGCSSAATKADTKSTEPKVAAETAPPLSGLSNNVVIQGVVTYFENRLLIGNQILIVQLEDISRTDAPAEMIAEYNKPIRGQLPLYFAIHYDPKQLQVGHRYNLRAKIIDGDTGVTNWSSNETYPYVPGITKDINIKVQTVNYQARKSSQFQTFLCGKDKLQILLIGNRIQLSFQGRQWILERVQSASGAKYQTGPITFWTQGQSAIYAEQGKPARRCLLVP